MKNFLELNLSPPIAKAIAEMGYETPTPIQAQTIPALLGEPTDFLGMAATGTGKTAAFGIPLIEQINVKNRAIQAVILCPTRELAVQVSQQLSQIGSHKQVRTLTIYGGADFREQIRNLRHGAHIVVATPGRLSDHLRRKTLSLANVLTVVLDEADEMISMGFQDDLEFLLKNVPKEISRIWLFAATLNPPLRKVADRYLRSPKVAQVNLVEMLSGTVTQIFYTVREKNKPGGLCKLIEMADDFYGLIFCQTKALVVELTDYLKRHGYKVDCLHGDMGQPERERTLKSFREKKVTILVCSDVAARGLDVRELTHVVNYSLPRDLESYVHRIGRTGRIGKTGIAWSLVAPAQMHLIPRIEKLTKTKMESRIFPNRKEISRRKLERVLPSFVAVQGHEKARAILNEDWTRTLEGLTKEEITGRFLAMAFPSLFTDVEEALTPASPAPQKSDRFVKPWQRKKPFKPFHRNKGERFRSREHHP